jgi:hypothetical protein
MALRLLDVSVPVVDPMRWKWCVLHGTGELAAGFESTRETAQRQGDAALFQLLTAQATTSYRDASSGRLTTSCIISPKPRNGR